MYYFDNGDVYRGEFSNDQFNGKGVFKSKNYEYDGDFVDGIKEGFGVYKLANGDIYEGNFVAGKFHGQGGQLFLFIV